MVTCAQWPFWLQFALRKLLQPFAWAHAPMENRLSDLKPPVTFIYGENDWMDPHAAERICEILQAGQSAAESPSSGSIPHRNKVLYIEGTGHFAFMEKPEVFNALLLETIAHCLVDDLEKESSTTQAQPDFKGVSTGESNQIASLQSIEAAFVDV